MAKIAILMLGAPGSGKGTQAKFIMDKFNFIQLSTGDILRGLKKKPAESLTEAQKEAILTMDSGKLVSNALVSQLLADEIAVSGGEKVIFDGFPRNQAQISIFEELLKQNGFEVLIPVFLRVDDEILKGRMETRIAEMKALGQEPRADDTPETFAIRLATFHQETDPVIDHYASHANFIRLDALADTKREEVWSQLESQLTGMLAQ